MGGGGGGGNGYSAAGGAGYVVTKTLDVRSGQKYRVVVGAGGTGAISLLSDTTLKNNTDGGISSFGDESALGGKTVKADWTTYATDGGAGSSGGGAGGENCCANGGSGGSDGQHCLGATYGPDKTYSCGKGGKGQGSYLEALKLFASNTFTAGDGGLAGTGNHLNWNPGGGGGGVLMNGNGPAAGNGLAPSGHGKGGKGYGAGGGGGGFTSDKTCHGGGNGANGLVYVEWG